MVVLCDTSVLVPAFFKGHIHHSRTFPLIQKIMDGKVAGVAAQHSLAECYASFTRVPNLPPVSPVQAREMIQKNIVPSFKIVALTVEDYMSAVDCVAEKDLLGGAIYDAIIWQAAVKGKVDHFVTWNLRHFERLSDGNIKIVTPEALK